MTAHSPRSIALLMAREIDEQDAPEDAEYIDEWKPEHRSHPANLGGPDCAACWMHDYDQAATERDVKALRDAATALYSDPTAEHGTTKAANNAIYAAWLLDRANALAAGKES